jgi:hypothetical protein
VAIYRCDASKKRVIISNAIPDHSIKLWRQKNPCEVPYAVELPLFPQNPDPNRDPEDDTEIPIRGMVGMAKNGVPVFGAQETDGANAVDPTGSVQDAQYWYGHPNTKGGWHIHNPHMGVEFPEDATFLGWAMDGFRIYGPLNGTEEEMDLILDECNGIEINGTYRYHVRTIDQVSKNDTYCNGDSPVTNWNYLLGCYAESIDRANVANANHYSLPSDCIRESEGGCTDDPDWHQGGNETRDCDWVGANDTEARCAENGNEAYDSCPGTCKNTECVREPDPPEPPFNGTVPNIIIMQPDDLPFLEEWGPPPKSPTTSDSENIPVDGNGDGLMPHIEALRTGGLQMMQAYTASPVCGTSRYSTITGKMPARAASVREKGGDQPSKITIPTTKLDATDCSEQNLAAAFQSANRNYKTGMIGKWHLTKFNNNDFDYGDAVDHIEGCGFDFVGGALFVFLLFVFCFCLLYS